MRLGLPVATLVLALPALATAQDLPQLKSRGSLRAMVAADEAPETFSFQPGSSPGFERELVEQFARLHERGVEVVRAKGYADRIPMLLAGDGDVIVAIFDTPERRRQVDFTLEVMPTRNVAVTIGSSAVADLAELRRRRVAALQGGRIAAAVLPVSELALATRRVSGLRAGIDVGAAGSVAWAVRKPDELLKRALNDYVSNLRKSASWNRLILKYFSDQALNVLGRSR